MVISNSKLLVYQRLNSLWLTSHRGQAIHFWVNSRSFKEILSIENPKKGHWRVLFLSYHAHKDRKHIPAKIVVNACFLSFLGVAHVYLFIVSHAQSNDQK